MAILFLLLSIVTILSTFIKLIKKDSWWIRFFDFPQAQLVIVGLVSFFGLIAVWDFQSLWQIIVLAIVALSTLYETIIVFPYTWVAPRESHKIKSATSGNGLSLMISNVYMYNKSHDRCLEIIEKMNPDIVLLVETNMKWEQGVKDIENEYPFQIKYPLDNTYGILMYSKLELLRSEVKFMVEEDVPSIHTYVKLRNGDEIKLYAIHPKPPSPTENDRSTERDAELYLVAKEIEQIEGPVIVAGDLNDVAWSRSTRIFQRISRLLDPRKGRGFFNTFHAKIPILRWPLDHVFHSSHFKLLVIKRLPKIGSDHFPMFISLAYTPEGPKDHSLEGPADEEELQEAKEKISAAL